MSTELTEYKIPQGIKATKTALVLPDIMDPEDWVQLGHFLRSSEDSLGLWQADWRKYGYTHYERKFVDSTVEQMDFRLHGIEKLELWGEILPEHRHKELTQEHFLVVAKRVKDEDQRKVWLDTAQIEGLNPRELQASIRASEVVRIDLQARRVSFPTPYAVRTEYLAWRKELGDGDKNWSAEDYDDVLDALRPVFNGYCELAAKREQLIKQ